MSLDFTPAPAAAARGRMVRNHALTEASLILRNGEQLVVALVIPLALLLFGRFAGGRFGIDESSVAPNVLTLAVWSSCFTSLAIATAFERRYGVLERLSATPLGRGGLLSGKALGITLVALGQLVLLGVVALALGWRPQPAAAQWPVLLLGLPLGMFVFANLAVAMAGVLRAEATLALANLVYLLGLVLGGIMWPVASYPAAMQPVVAALPTGALGEVVRHWSAGSTSWLPLFVLLVWAVISYLLARKAFRWTS